MALNDRVLLLNQTYEPLGTVSVARAVIMTFKNTVYVEELDGGRAERNEAIQLVDSANGIDHPLAGEHLIRE